MHMDVPYWRRHQVLGVAEQFPDRQLCKLQLTVDKKMVCIICTRHSDLTLQWNLNKSYMYKSSCSKSRHNDMYISLWICMRDNCVWPPGDLFNGYWLHTYLVHGRLTSAIIKPLMKLASSIQWSGKMYEFNATLFPMSQNSSMIANTR